MELRNEQFVEYWNKCRDFVDDISKNYEYPTNISHLLYFLVPAFVFQYGLREETLIFSVFKNIKIIIEDRNDEVQQASFCRVLKKSENGYYTEKSIHLYYYDRISLMQLLDNLVHEFNHAINSVKNEIWWNEQFVFVRTGLTYFQYDPQTLRPIGKQKDVLLEEIINTRQTEKIIERIASFGKYAVSDTVFINVLYAIRKEVMSGYRSRAYYLQASICRKLLKNKTFIHTFENLRFQGEIIDLCEWFDHIAGREGSFQRIQDLLVMTSKLEHELISAKWFRRRRIQKIQKNMKELSKIVDTYNKNCNFK